MSLTPTIPAASPAADLAALGRANRGPQVPRPRSRWRSRVLLPAVLFLITGGVLAYAARDALVRPLDVRVVPVIAREARGGSAGAALGVSVAGGAPAVQAPGWIEPDPYAINVPALVDGVVREVLALEGDSVAEDQVVARLIDEDHRLAVRSAEALVHEREADVLKAGAAIEPMRSAIAIAESEADVIRDEIDRKKGLLDRGGVAAGELSRLEIRLRGAQSRIDQARGELAGAEASVKQAAAALQTAEVMLAEAQLRLKRTEVRSPAAGVVLARLVSPGTRIAVTSKGSESADMTSTLLRLYNPSRLQVRADVPLAEAASIGLETPAEITTEAIPGEKFSGRVVRVVHEANIQRNTVQFKVAIENPSPRMKPEMLARVRFNPGSAAGRAAPGSPDDMGLELLLPTEAVVQRSGDRAKVWILEQGGSTSWQRASLRDATLGGERDGEVQVLSGVRPGDRAVVSPPDSLCPGSRVGVTADSDRTKTP